jgi:hypothetical protein
LIIVLIWNYKSFSQNIPTNTVKPLLKNIDGKTYFCFNVNQTKFLAKTRDSLDNYKLVRKIQDSIILKNNNIINKLVIKDSLTFIDLNNCLDKAEDFNNLLVNEINNHNNTKKELEKLERKMKWRNGLLFGLSGVIILLLII